MDVWYSKVREKDESKSRNADREDYTHQNMESTAKTTTDKTMAPKSMNIIQEQKERN